MITSCRNFCISKKKRFFQFPWNYAIHVKILIFCISSCRNASHCQTWKHFSTFSEELSIRVERIPLNFQQRIISSLKEERKSINNEKLKNAFPQFQSEAFRRKWEIVSLKEEETDIFPRVISTQISILIRISTKSL